MKDARKHLDMIERTVKTERPECYPFAIVREDMSGTSGERIVIDKAASVEAAEASCRKHSDSRHYCYYFEATGLRIGSIV